MLCRLLRLQTVWSGRNRETGVQQDQGDTIERERQQETPLMSASTNSARRNQKRKKHLSERECPLIGPTDLQGHDHRVLRTIDCDPWSLV